MDCAVVPSTAHAFALAEPAVRRVSHPISASGAGCARARSLSRLTPSLSGQRAAPRRSPRSPLFLCVFCVCGRARRPIATMGIQVRRGAARAACVSTLETRQPPPAHLCAPSSFAGLDQAAQRECARLGQRPEARELFRTAHRGRRVDANLLVYGAFSRRIRTEAGGQGGGRGAGRPARPGSAATYTPPLSSSRSRRSWSVERVTRC